MLKNVDVRKRTFLIITSLLEYVIHRAGLTEGGGRGGGDTAPGHPQRTPNKILERSKDF